MEKHKPLPEIAPGLWCRPEDVKSVRRCPRIAGIAETLIVEGASGHLSQYKTEAIPQALAMLRAAGVIAPEQAELSPAEVHVP